MFKYLNKHISFKWFHHHHTKVIAMISVIVTDDSEDEPLLDFYDLFFPGALYTATSPIPEGFNIYRNNQLYAH